MTQPRKILCIALILTMLLCAFSSCVKDSAISGETETGTETETDSESTSERQEETESESETEDPMKDYTLSEGKISEYNVLEKNVTGDAKISLRNGKYTIVRGRNVSQEEIDKGGINLYKKIIETAKFTPKITSDSTKPVKNEIIIGNTTREESAELSGVAYLDYGWKVVGTRVVIFGGSPDALARAVDVFVQKYYNSQTKDFEIPSDAHYLATYNYIYEDIKVDEVSILDSVVYYGDGYEAEANFFAKQIGMLSGARLDIKPASEGGDMTSKAIKVAVTHTGSIDTAYYIENGILCFEGNGPDKKIDALNGVIEMFIKEKIPVKDEYSTANIDKNCASTVTTVIEHMEYADGEFIASLDEKFDQRREEILGAASEWETAEGGKVFYVSNNGDDSNDGLTPETAWKTLKKVSYSTAIGYGDVVLFERGGVWNLMDKNENDILELRSGITVSAYGDPSASKPLITAAINANEPDDWIEVEENLWVYNGWYTSEFNSFFPNDESLPGQYIISNNLADGGDDIGCIALTRKSDGKIGWGIKIMKYTGADLSVDIETVSNGFESITRGKEAFVDQKDLKSNLEFYHNYKESRLYLYCEGNPTEIYFDIILSGRRYGIKGLDNTTIDNIAVKHVGIHGVSGTGAKNFVMRNCEIGWIGGTIQTYEFMGREHPTRLGEGIQNAYDCDGFTVINNYFYQVYDGAVSSQMTRSPSTKMKNIYVAGNIFEDNVACIEMWMNNVQGENYQFVDMLVEDNMMRNIAMGFGHAKPVMRMNVAYGDIDDVGDALQFSVGMTSAQAINCRYVNNTIWRSAKHILRSMHFHMDPDDKGVQVYGNLIVHEYGSEFGGLCRDPYDKKESWDMNRWEYNSHTIEYMTEHKVLGENTYYFTYSY